MLIRAEVLGEPGWRCVRLIRNSKCRRKLIRPIHLARDQTRSLYMLFLQIFYKNMQANSWIYVTWHHTDVLIPIFDWLIDWLIDLSISHVSIVHAGSWWNTVCSTMYKTRTNTMLEVTITYLKRQRGTNDFLCISESYLASS